MSEQPRFELRFELFDRRDEFHPLRWAVGCDDELRVSDRAVDDLKMCAPVGGNVMSMDTVVKMMRVREFRRDLLRDAAVRCVGQFCDYLEDSEGWHDASRTDRAREIIGYKT